MPISDGDIGTRRLRSGELTLHKLNIDGGGVLYFEGLIDSTDYNCENQLYPAYAYVRCNLGNPEFVFRSPQISRYSSSTYANDRIEVVLTPDQIGINAYSSQQPLGTSLMIGGMSLGESTFSGIEIDFIRIGRAIMWLDVSTDTAHKHLISRSTDVDSNGLHFLVASTAY